MIPIEDLTDVTLAIEDTDEDDEDDEEDLTDVTLVSDDTYWRLDQACYVDLNWIKIPIIVKLSPSSFNKVLNTLHGVQWNHFIWLSTAPGTFQSKVVLF